MHLSNSPTFLRIKTSNKTNQLYPIFTDLTPKTIFLPNYPNQHILPINHNKNIFSKSSNHILTPKASMKKLHSPLQNHQDHSFNANPKIYQNHINALNITNYSHRNSKTHKVVLENDFINNYQLQNNNINKYNFKQRGSNHKQKPLGNIARQNKSPYLINIQKQTLKQTKRIDFSIDNKDQTNEDNDKTFVTISQNSTTLTKNKTNFLQDNKFNLQRQQNIQKPQIVVSFNNIPNCNQLQLSFNSNINKSFSNNMQKNHIINHHNIVNQKIKNKLQKSRISKVKSKQLQTFSMLEQSKYNSSSYIEKIQKLQNDNLRLKQKLSQLRSDYQNIIQNLNQQSKSILKELIQFKLQNKLQNQFIKYKNRYSVSQFESNSQKIRKQMLQKINNEKVQKKNIINQILKRLNQIIQIASDQNNRYLIFQFINLVKQQFLEIKKNQQLGNNYGQNNKQNSYKNSKISQSLQILYLCVQQKLKQKQKEFNKLKQQHEQFKKRYFIMVNQLNKNKQKYCSSSQHFIKDLKLTKIAFQQINCDSQFKRIKDYQKRKLQPHQLLKQQLVQIIEQAPTQSLKSSNYNQQQFNEIHNQNNLLFSQAIQNQTFKTSSAQLSHFNNIQQCYNEVLSVFGIRTHVHSHYQLMKQVSTFQECLAALLNKCKQKDIQLKKSIQESLQLKKKYIETIKITQKLNKQFFLKDDSCDSKNNQCQYTLSNDDQYSQPNSCESTVNKISLDF